MYLSKERQAQANKAKTRLQSLQASTRADSRREIMLQEPSNSTSLATTSGNVRRRVAEPSRRGGHCDSFRILFKQANGGRPRAPSMKLIMDRPSTGRRERPVVDIHTRHDNYLSLLLFFPFGHAALQMDCEHVRPVSFSSQNRAHCPFRHHSRVFVETTTKKATCRFSAIAG
jgi:hypothetical protein